MTYRILSPALLELSEAAKYYESKVTGLGSDFLDESEAVIARILDFPDTWSYLTDGFRHCNFRRFPYTVVYSVLSENEIMIVSVFHQHREPLSWKRNL